MHRCHAYGLNNGRRCDDGLSSLKLQWKFYRAHHLMVIQRQHWLVRLLRTKMLVGMTSRIESTHKLDTLYHCIDAAETDVLQSKVSHLLSGTVSKATFTNALLASLLRHSLSWRPLPKIANHSQQPSFGKISCWDPTSTRKSAQAAESKLYKRCC